MEFSEETAAALAAVDTVIQNGKVYVDINTITEMNSGIFYMVLKIVQANAEARPESADMFANGAAYAVDSYFNLYDGLMDLHASELVPDDLSSLEES